MALQAAEARGLNQAGDVQLAKLQGRRLTEFHGIEATLLNQTPQSLVTNTEPLHHNGFEEQTFLSIHTFEKALSGITQTLSPPGGSREQNPARRACRRFPRGFP